MTRNANDPPDAATSNGSETSPYRGELMNIVAPSAATIQSADLSIVCPEWCSSEQPHDMADVRLVKGEEEGLRVVVEHRGPRFGPFPTYGETRVDGTDACCGLRAPSQDIAVCVTVDEVKGLKQLAAHAEAAAAWIVAHTTD